MFKCDKNRVPYYNVQSFKNENFGNFGPLIEHGPHWKNFTNFSFINESNRYF